MRVEHSKQKHTDKKETSNFKIEKSVFDSSTQNKTANATGSASQPGAFAKILDEARQQSGSADKKIEKDGAGAPDSAKTSESEDKKEADRRIEREKDLEKRNRGGQHSGEHKNGDQQGDNGSAALASNGFFADTNSSAEIAAPAARSILHVADLERIVSCVRTQNFADSKQILIALKHSVLDGLQIKLSLSENGNFKAEFLAANQNIKKQLKKREAELEEILKRRSARFTTIEITTPSED